MKTENLKHAISFAEEAHRGQLRKGSDSPYIEHPVRVARMLEDMGADSDMIIAGVLHDTVEDTYVTIDDVKREFGGNVARLVDGVSESNRLLPWEMRKKSTIRKLRTAPFDICLISACDKIDNLRSTSKEMERIGSEVWKRFHRGPEKQEWYHRGVLESLRENPSISGHEVVGMLEEQIRRVFGDKIKNAE